MGRRRKKPGPPPPGVTVSPPAERKASDELFTLYQATRHRRILPEGLAKPASPGALYMDRVENMVHQDCTAGKSLNPTFSQKLRTLALDYRTKLLELQVSHLDWLINHQSGLLLPLDLTQNSLKDCINRVRDMGHKRYGRSTEPEDLRFVEDHAKKVIIVETRPKRPFGRMEKVTAKSGTATAGSPDTAGPPAERLGTSAGTEGLSQVSTANRYAILAGVEDEDAGTSGAVPKPQRPVKKGRRGAGSSGPVRTPGDVVAPSTPKKRGRRSSSVGLDGSPDLPASKRVSDRSSPVTSQGSPPRLVLSGVDLATPATPGGRGRRRHRSSPGSGESSPVSPERKRPQQDGATPPGAVSTPPSADDLNPDETPSGDEAESSQGSASPTVRVDDGAESTQDSTSPSERADTPPPGVPSFSPRRFPVPPQNKTTGKKLLGIWNIPKIKKDKVAIGSFDPSVKFKDQDLQVLSYPGMKLSQFKNLVNNFKFGHGSREAGRMPSKILVSLGTFDQHLTLNTAQTQFNQVLLDLEKEFPNSQQFVAAVPSHPGYSAEQKKWVTDLNTFLQGKCRGRDLVWVPYAPLDPQGMRNPQAEFDHLIQSLN